MGGNPKRTPEQQEMRDDGKCAARTRGGSYCKQRAGWGTEHPGQGPCKKHGGLLPAHNVAAERERALQQAELYGLPREVDPHEALLEELHRTAGHVSWLTMMIQELTDANALHESVGGGQGGFPSTEAHIWIRLQQEERRHFARVAKSCIEAGIEERRVQLAEDQGALIAGVLRHVLQDLGIDPTSPEARAVVRQRLSAIEAEARPLEPA